MQLALVTGNLVATIKTKSHENYKILVIRPIDIHGRISGDSTIALDTAQAGVGDCVLVLQEGNSIRSIMRDDEAAVDALIVGVVDFIEIDGKQRELTLKLESDC